MYSNRCLHSDVEAAVKLQAGDDHQTPKTLQPLWQRKISLFVRSHKADPQAHRNGREHRKQTNRHAWRASTPHPPSHLNGCYIGCLRFHLQGGMEAESKDIKEVPHLIQQFLPMAINSDFIIHNATDYLPLKMKCARLIQTSVTPPDSQIGRLKFPEKKRHMNTSFIGFVRFLLC